MSPYYQALRRAMGTSLLLIPGVAAIVRDEAGRLLLQRKHDGSWHLPAGAVEPGETPQEAVVREVAEETGVRCVVERLLTVFGGAPFRHTYPNGDLVEPVSIVFACRPVGEGPVTDTAETAGTGWFARAELPPLAMPYPLYPLDLLFPS